MKDGTSREIAMDDESLPLHFYSIENGSTLTVVNPFISLNIVNILHETYYKQFPRDFILWEVKKTMISAKRFYGHFDFYDIIMFTKTGDNVCKKFDLDLNVPIGDIFSDGDTVYLSVDNFFERSCPLYFQGNKIGKVGLGHTESVLSAKLRTQEQTEIPAQNIRILYLMACSRGRSRGGPRGLGPP